MNPPGTRCIVVIVDGYFTGCELLSELLERNVECHHLQSTPELPAVVLPSFDARPYDANYGYLGPPESAAEVLAAIRPHAVIAGSEWGVMYAEELSRRLGLPGNRPASARARRNKFEMVETVARAGLRTPRQIVLDSPHRAVRWAEAQRCWPVVVKPLCSAAADGVFICRDGEDIRRAFAEALNRRNLMGGLNRRLLLQSFLEGPQYIVNTVGLHGQQRVTDVWHMAIRALPGSAIVLDELHLLDADAPHVRRLIAYTFDVLAALGIENGSAHTELKWTAQGPALIEVGARLMSTAMDRGGYAAARMQTQAGVWAELLAGDEARAQQLIEAGHYVRRRPLSKVFFSFPAEGVVQEVRGLERLRGLASFQAHHRALKVGDRVWRTADTLACGGVVYLAHDDLGVVDADLRQLRAWERDGDLYRILADAPVGLRPW